MELGDFWLQLNNGKQIDLSKMSSGLWKKDVDKKFHSLFDAFDFDKNRLLTAEEAGTLFNFMQIMAGEDKGLSKDEEDVLRIFLGINPEEEVSLAEFIESFEAIEESREGYYEDGTRIIQTTYKNGNIETILFYPDGELKLREVRIPKPENSSSESISKDTEYEVKREYSERASNELHEQSTDWLIWHLKENLQTISLYQSDKGFLEKSTEAVMNIFGKSLDDIQTELVDQKYYANNSDITVYNKKVGGTFDPAKYEAFRETNSKYMNARFIKGQLDGLKRGLNRLRASVHRDELKRQGINTSSTKTTEELFAEIFNNFCAGDRELAQRLITDIAGDIKSIEDVSSAKMLEIANKFECIVNKMLEDTLDGEPYADLEKRFQSEYKYLYGNEDYTDYIQNRIGKIEGYAGLEKIAIITITQIVIAILTSGGSAAVEGAAGGAVATGGGLMARLMATEGIKELVAVYGEARVMRWIQETTRFLMLTGTVAEDIGIGFLNAATSESGITWEKSQNILEQGKSAAKYIYFGGYISGPVATFIGSQIKTAGAVSRAFRGGTKVTQGPITTTTITADKFLGSMQRATEKVTLNNFWKVDPLKLAAGAASLSAEIGAFTLLDLATEDVNVKDALSSSTDMQVKLKVMNRVLETLLGGLVGKISRGEAVSMPKLDAEINRVIKKAEMQKINILEYESPSGKIYSIESGGKVLLSAKDPNMLVVSLASYVSQNIDVTKLLDELGETVRAKEPEGEEPAEQTTARVRKPYERPITEYDKPLTPQKDLCAGTQRAPLDPKTSTLADLVKDVKGDINDSTPVTEETASAIRNAFDTNNTKNFEKIEKFISLIPNEHCAKVLSVYLNKFKDSIQENSKGALVWLNVALDQLASAKDIKEFVEIIKSPKVSENLKTPIWQVMDYLLLIPSVYCSCDELIELTRLGLGNPRPGNDAVNYEEIFYIMDKIYDPKERAFVIKLYNSKLFAGIEFDELTEIYKYHKNIDFSKLKRIDEMIDTNSFSIDDINDILDFIYFSESTLETISKRNLLGHIPNRSSKLSLSDIEYFAKIIDDSLWQKVLDRHLLEDIPEWSDTSDRALSRYEINVYAKLSDAEWNNLVSRKLLIKPETIKEDLKSLYQSTEFIPKIAKLPDSDYAKIEHLVKNPNDYVKLLMAVIKETETGTYLNEPLLNYGIKLCEFYGGVNERIMLTLHRLYDKDGNFNSQCADRLYDFITELDKDGLSKYATQVAFCDPLRDLNLFLNKPLRAEEFDAKIRIYKSMKNIDMSDLSEIEIATILYETNDITETSIYRCLNDETLGFTPKSEILKLFKLSDAEMEFLLSQDIEAIREKVEYQKQLALSAPDRYVSGEYDSVEQMQDAVEKFFDKYNAEIMLMASIYDKEALNALLRTRFDEVTDYFNDISPVFETSDFELLQKMSASCNAYGKPFMPIQKIELIALIKAYKSSNLALDKLYTMLESGKIDIGELNLDLFRHVMRNIGMTEDEISSIPKEKLIAWDMKYVHLLTNEIHSACNSAFSDMLKAANLDDFERYIHDVSNKYGKANARTQELYRAKGMNYEKWIHPDKANELNFKSLDKNYEKLLQISEQIVEDVETLRQNPALRSFIDKRFPKCIKEGNFVIPSEYTASKDKLFNFTKTLLEELKSVWQRAQGNLQNSNSEIAARARHTITIAGHLKQRSDDILELEAIESTKSFDVTIKMWDRVPQKDIFQGNYSTCCIGIGSSNGRAMPHYILNTAYNMIELVDSKSGLTIGNALCYFVTGKDGKPKFVIDNIEIKNSEKPSDEVGKKLRQQITNYAYKVARDVIGSNDVEILIGESYNDVPTDDLKFRRGKVSFFGEIDCDDIYMDLYDGWVDRDWDAHETYLDLFESFTNNVVRSRENRTGSYTMSCSYSILKPDKSVLNPAKNAETPSIASRLEAANDRKAFAAIRDEIKNMPEGAEKQKLTQLYLQRYNEWSANPARPDIRMQYTPIKPETLDITRLKIAKATENDLREIQKIDLESFDGNYTIDSDFEAYKGDLEAQEITTYVIKSNDGKIIGYYQLEPIENNELYIYSIGVRSELRNTRASYAALIQMQADIAKIAQEKNLEKVVLDVDAENAILVKLYKKFGFEVTSESRGIDAGHEYHDLHMEADVKKILGNSNVKEAIKTVEVVEAKETVKTNEEIAVSAEKFETQDAKSAATEEQLSILAERIDYLNKESNGEDHKEFLLNVAKIDIKIAEALCDRYKSISIGYYESIFEAISIDKDLTLEILNLKKRRTILSSLSNAKQEYLINMFYLSDVVKSAKKNYELTMEIMNFAKENNLNANSVANVVKIAEYDKDFAFKVYKRDKSLDNSDMSHYMGALKIDKKLTNYLLDFKKVGIYRLKKYELTLTSVEISKIVRANNKAPEFMSDVHQKIISGEIDFSAYSEIAQIVNQFGADFAYKRIEDLTIAQKQRLLKEISSWTHATGQEKIVHEMFPSVPEETDSETITKLINNLSKELNTKPERISDNEIRNFDKDIQKLYDANAASIKYIVEKYLTGYAKELDAGLLAKSQQLLEKIVNRKEFQLLSENDKKLTVLSSLFTNIIKETNNEVMAFAAYNEALRLGVSEYDASKLYSIVNSYNLIEQFMQTKKDKISHPYDEQFDITQRNLVFNRLAFNLKEGNTFELAQLVYSSREVEGLTRHLDKLIKSRIEEIKADDFILYQTPVEEYVQHAKKAIITHGKTTYEVSVVDSKEIENFYALCHYAEGISGAKGDRPKTQRYAKLSALENISNDRAYCAAYINGDNTCVINDGFILVAPNDKMYVASGHDMGSMGKNISSVLEEYFISNDIIATTHNYEGPQETKNEERKMVSRNLKEIMGIDDAEYIRRLDNIKEQLQGKTLTAPLLQQIDPEMAAAYTEFLSRVNSDGAHGSTALLRNSRQEWNEVIISNPTVAGIYTNDLQNISVQMLEYAQEHNVPIVLIGPGNKSKAPNPSIKITYMNEITKPEVIAAKAFNELRGNKGVPAITSSDIDAASDVIRAHYSALKPFLTNQVENLGLNTLGSFKYRIKGATSLKDKIKEYVKDKKHNDKTMKDVVDAVRDVYAARTVFKAQDLTNHPEVRVLIEAGKRREAELRAAEIQSGPVLQKLKEAMKKASEGDTDLSMLRISNYTSEEGIPILSESQLAELKLYGSKIGVNVVFIDPVDDIAPGGKFVPKIGGTTKIQDSGYTALQLNFITSTGEIIEWQYRGELVDEFAEAEHLLYDYRTGKSNPWTERPELKSLCEPVLELVRDGVMDPDVYKALNKYLTDVYTVLRRIELGFKADLPKLEDYEINGCKFDRRLDARNLITLHEIAEKVKSGEILPENSVAEYNKAINARNLE